MTIPAQGSAGRKHGFFLTVDGPGGTGKSTTVTAVVDLFRASGVPVHATTEPSTSPLGLATRQLADEVRGVALALLVAADRRHHLSTEIDPLLEDGHTVICDRYLPSSLVLQRLDGVDLEFVQAINAGITLPDLAVILTASAGTIHERLRARGAHDRFERDRDNVRRELELYAEAVAILQAMQVPVLRVDTDSLGPVRAAQAIVRAAGHISATVSATISPSLPSESKHERDP
jgi:dTMP kinase